MTSPATTCPSCGKPAEGRFCSDCGTSLAPRACTACAAPLSPRAAFCHRCGTPAPGAPVPALRGAVPLPRSERGPWLFAGIACVGIVIATAIFLNRQHSAAASATPDMANAGGAAGNFTRPAPDISQMTPREQFDRLFDRVTRAAVQGDTAQVIQFMPMALGAYALVPDPDLDARFHAALLHLDIGDWAGARALADTMLVQQPGNLYAYLVRGTAAGFEQEQAALQQARRDFEQRYAEEMRIRGTQYAEHADLIDTFHREAQAAGVTP